MNDRVATHHTGYDWFVALGSNIGDGRENLQQARRALNAYGRVVEASSIYESAPMYDEEQPRFHNAVVWLRSTLNGGELLQGLQRVEAEFGRVRESARRYGPRAIDLDIVAGSNQTEGVVVESPGLQIPHPRMHERAFVLVPLAEIVSQWRHPVLDRTLDELLQDAGQDNSLRVVFQSEEWA